MGTLRIGVIGCGSISALHGNTWQRVPEAEVVACADVDAAKAHEFRERLRGADAVTDYARPTR